MRIVIIGEFSSFSKNLSEGFRAIGHECFVFSWGDGFKKIVQDSNYSYNVFLQNKSKKGLYGFLSHGISSLLSNYRLKTFVKSMSVKKKWDVVLVINQSFIKQKGRFWSPLFSIDMIKSLLIDSNNIYLSACGRDIPYCDYWGKIKNKNSDLVELLSSECFNKRQISHHKMCLKSIYKIIPVMYDYAEAWRKSQYAKGSILCDTIPLPINCNSIEEHNIISNKIYIFHGIIRPKHKGSDLIVEAMERLINKYPDKVICEVKGGMPLASYLDVLKKTNILIDQTFSYGYGMNAIYGLAQGKIVLSGNEVENQEEYGVKCPIINIKPDVNQIYNQLERLILDYNIIGSLSIESRNYAMKVHDSKIIAQKYIDTFNKYNSYGNDR